MKKILLYLILVMAILMAGIVAYVSVGGLLKVFSGAGTLGLLFFSAIEIAKIVATSAIHTYGKKIGLIYKLLLSIGITITMIITSVGIYGFLSSTYKETFIKLEGIEGRVTLLEKKRDGIQSQLDVVDKEKNSINTRISELSSGLSNNVIQYKDRETGQIITTTSSSTRRVLERQLNKAIERQDELNIKSDDLNTNIFDLDNEILEVKVGNDTAAELGPLKYLSEVTGKSMDEVMKYFIFLLILIGDPMAVLMVIVFNKVVKKPSEYKKPISKPEPKGNIYDTDGTITTERIVTQPKVEITEEVIPVTPTEPPNSEGLKSYMDIIEEPKEEIKVEEPPKQNKGNRGFSVSVPDRKVTNTVNRIGSNKEVRDGNNNTIYFKKRS
tara:strand:+ start:18355 stop:19503 length:1149 start_codon:yes stop_codon:yes gene_type:complete